MNSRERVLGLLKRQAVDRIACFSGMGNVTLAGLAEYGYKFSDIHNNARMMAAAAASSYRLFGYECAVAPFDMCVEAEALGCTMNAYESLDQVLYPTINQKICESLDELLAYPIPADVVSRGRVPLVCEALSLLKQDVGREVAVGSYLLGPYTLAGQLMDLDQLFKLTYKRQQDVTALLGKLAAVIVEIARAYQRAGADYICIREMGATSDVISPMLFNKVIVPSLKQVSTPLQEIPTVMHICGGTDKIVKGMNDVGCTALSVEAKNDLAHTREVIGSEPLVFGNVDSYELLCMKQPEDVEQAVLRSIAGGVDGVWPSCDIWPTAKLENLQAMVSAVKRHGAAGWARKQAG